MKTMIDRHTTNAINVKPTPPKAGNNVLKSNRPYLFLRYTDTLGHIAGQGIHSQNVF